MHTEAIQKLEGKKINTCLMVLISSQLILLFK